MILARRQLFSQPLDQQVLPQVLKYPFQGHEYMDYLRNCACELQLYPFKCFLGQYAPITNQREQIEQQEFDDMWRQLGQLGHVQTGCEYIGLLNGFLLSASNWASQYCKGYNDSIKKYLLRGIFLIIAQFSTTMYLRYYLDESGKRVYTMKVVLEDGSYTLNAHPARFSPDDRFSKERIQCKERFGLLLTQVEEPKY